ncbi:MAG: methylmalonyl-CoA mutase family protein, partial [Candidatus Hodarchaeales archaeon]
VLDAISKGIIQQKIHESAYLHERLVEKQERIIVGVNKHKQEKYEIPELLKIDDSVAKDQVSKLKKTREQRDQQKVNEILNTLENAAKSTDNLFPIILDAVRARASLGEITNTLISVFGRYKPSFTI